MANGLYLKLKALLPDGLRDALSTVNQHFFARTTLQRKHGDWFEVDWRKKFQAMPPEEWIRAYDEVWKHHTNNCVDETDADMIISVLERSLQTENSSATVLEVGCGFGSLAIAMARAGFQTTCVDVSNEALRRAEARANNESVTITWKQGFAEALPMADKSVDFITCCHTLEHVKDLAAATAELKRVARKKLVVLVPRQKYRLYADNYHTQFFSHPDDLIRAFGLERYECTEINYLGRESEFQGEALLYVGYL